MAIDNAQPVGCTTIDVAATATVGDRLDVEGYYADGIEVTGIAGGCELQPHGCIERGSDGVTLGSVISADGIYPLVTPPWTLDMPLSEVWIDRTVAGSGQPVVTLHYTRRF